MKIFLFFFLLQSNFLFAQSLDSLKSVWKNVQPDSTKVDMLNNITLKMIFESIDSTLLYANLAYQLTQKINYPKGLARHYAMLGILYRTEGDYIQAVSYTIKGLEIYEKLAYLRGIASSYVNLGLIYAAQNQYDLAMENYQKCLAIKKKQNDLFGVANCINDMGELAVKQQNYDQALKYYIEAAELRKKQNDFYGVSRIDCNIAVVYLKTAKFSEAANLFDKVIPILEEHQDTFLLPIAYNGLGKIYENNKDYKKALYYFELALDLNKLHHHQQEVKNTYYNLSVCYFKLGKTDLGLTFLQNYTHLQDSLFSTETTKKIAKLQNTLENKKREAQIELFAKDKILQQKIISSHDFERNMWFVFSGLVLFFAFFMFKKIRKERKNNILLKEQKTEIEDKNKEIEVQNEEMKQHHEELISSNEALEQQYTLIETQRHDLEKTNGQLQETSERLNQSIRYAQNIQQGILPKQEQLKDFFSEHFVIYLPKDIVSGDFYWFSKISLAPFSQEEKEEIAILVLGDCTGHGVPGAFMTMIGNTLLHETVNIKCIYEPAQILKNIDSGIRTVLKQDQTKNYDGMDAGICLFERLEKKQTKITFSGAKSSLFYSENNEVAELVGDRLSIGGKSNSTKDFTDKIIILPKESMIYMSSDGFADQNDSNRKRYGMENFKKLLNSLAKLPLQTQKEQILLALKNHQQNELQRDDISLIGLRI
ncbi:MAG: tetratricopeptide repeat protein [Bacteroidetes bacterium]|nr:MAG: tetratricopeptide repeat protein [Bacteroidota bacterium]